mmetsp:Transcript_34115/g.75035  ORF Transcript_34115/g.75035 Transcript_34115/m.75035 type:complete len:241 (-) Transcript_34115:216-938(-)
MVIGIIVGVVVIIIVIVVFFARHLDTGLGHTAGNNHAAECPRKSGGGGSGRCRYGRRTSGARSRGWRRRTTSSEGRYPGGSASGRRCRRSLRGMGRRGNPVLVIVRVVELGRVDGRSARCRGDGDAGVRRGGSNARLGHGRLTARLGEGKRRRLQPVSAGRLDIRSWTAASVCAASKTQIRGRNGSRNNFISTPAAAAAAGGVTGADDTGDGEDGTMRHDGRCYYVIVAGYLQCNMYFIH